MKVKIYKPAQSPTQSIGDSRGKWLLEFEKEEKGFLSHPMGWKGSVDMNQEVTLKFNTEDEAMVFAIRNNLIYKIILPKEKKLLLQSYSDNLM